METFARRTATVRMVAFAIQAMACAIVYQGGMGTNVNRVSENSKE